MVEHNIREVFSCLCLCLDGKYSLCFPKLPIKCSNYTTIQILSNLLQEFRLKDAQTLRMNRGEFISESCIFEKLSGLTERFCVPVEASGSLDCCAKQEMISRFARSDPEG